MRCVTEKLLLVVCKNVFKNEKIQKSGRSHEESILHRESNGNIRGKAN